MVRRIGLKQNKIVRPAISQARALVGLDYGEIVKIGEGRTLMMQGAIGQQRAPAATPQLFCVPQPVSDPHFGPAICARPLPRNRKPR